MAPFEEAEAGINVAAYSSQHPPSQADTDSFIHDYFQLYHPAYPLLHEGTFRARVSGTYTQTLERAVLTQVDRCFS